MNYVEVAAEARGWMYEGDGPALRFYADAVADLGPLCEIGGYAGKSACWLGSVAREHHSTLFSIDWHRGSPEMAPGQDCHHPEMIGEDGRFDTLPHFRRNVLLAELEPWVVPVVSTSPHIGRFWTTPLAFLFIDGAHHYDGVKADYDLWAPHVLPGGVLAFHDTNIPDIAKVADEAQSDGFEYLDLNHTLRFLRRPCE